MFPVSDFSTVEHARVRAEEIAGCYVEGLTSPHLLRQGRQWCALASLLTLSLARPQLTDC